MRRLGRCGNHTDKGMPRTGARQRGALCRLVEAAAKLRVIIAVAIEYRRESALANWCEEGIATRQTYMGRQER